MVAYSFQKQFVPAIRSGQKRQTIRADRKRHARPGEALQLYAGMRTKGCFKIIDDPVCERVDDIRIDLRSLDSVTPAAETNEAIMALLRDVSVEVNGAPVLGDDLDILARADGFGTWSFIRSKEPMLPFVAMMSFWMFEHGAIDFRGALIRWEPK